MRSLSEIAIDADEVRSKFAFHAHLNPKIWEEDDLNIEVRVAMLRAALEFTRFLDVKGLRVADVIFTGSNAAYNYTDLSDLDVHIVVDFDKTACPDWAENFFNTKKTLWNQTHSVTIKGYGLEMYVEDVANPVKANGVYSLLKGEWLSHPKMDRPTWNDTDVLAKIEALADEIDALLSRDVEKAEIDQMFDRLRKMRRSGLAKGGEFSVENLAFKGLRNIGLIGLLADARREAEDRSLSLESQRPQ